MSANDSKSIGQSIIHSSATHQRKQRPSHHWPTEQRNSLTHWSFNKLANKMQTFCNAISWQKIGVFLSKLHLSLFLKVQSTIGQQWFRWWLGAKQVTSHYLDQFRPKISFLILTNTLFTKCTRARDTPHKTYDLRWLVQYLVSGPISSVWSNI